MQAPVLMRKTGAFIFCPLPIAMPVYVLDNSLKFPPAELAMPEGLLAAGGDLSVPRLLSAYRMGIFPWYNEGDPILWWSPDPRLVLYPGELHISRRLKRTIRKKRFEITFNQAFEQVIRMCAGIRKDRGEETWITVEMVEAYIQLHEEGWCWSTEAWLDGGLAGGLYGVRMGGVFFGESMFSVARDASKVAFAITVSRLEKEGVKIIDCQVPTRHLAGFGARLISRTKFLKEIEKWAGEPSFKGP